jgi:alpha-1,3-rhamnosyl/mannosyltransferase
MSMRVILNDRILLQKLTGVGHYARELLRHLRADDGLRVLSPILRSGAAPDAGRPGMVLTDRPRKPSEDGRKPEWLRRIILAAYGRYFRWRARGADLYHEPNHIPIRCELPTVTTIHDLSVLAYPEWHPADRVRWYEREFERGVRRTTRFIAASEFTKGQMVRRLGLQPERIDVTYQAARPGFRPISFEIVERTLAELRLARRFFLFVGTLEPRKNVPGLLDAYAALPARVAHEHPLVIAGGWGWNTDALRAKVEDAAARRNVRRIGYAPDDVLACLYSACTALVWPTWYEGFGLPPMEAMACGAPVIASNVAALPEVAGDAAILLDPNETAAWTAAMRGLAEDADRRAELAQRGVERAATFSWERCARQTVACYRRALGEE